MDEQQGPTVCNTGDYILWQTRMEKYEKHAYVCVIESLCCTKEISTTL